MTFNHTQPISWHNRAIEVQYSEGTDPREREMYFGDAKSFAEWLDAFDYSNGDVFGWTGDSATMAAVSSYRKGDMRAIPEFITEYDVNNETDPGKAIGADEFNRLFRMFHRKDGYCVRRWAVPVGHVYAVVFNGELTGPMWHVPTDADCVHA